MIYVATCICVHMYVWIFTDNDDYNKAIVKKFGRRMKSLKPYLNIIRMIIHTPEISEETPLYDKDKFSHKLIISWVLIFMLSLQAKHYLSDAAILSIFKFIYAVLLIIGKKIILETVFHHQNVHC